jgi:hypothetical protein
MGARTGAEGGKSEPKVRPNSRVVPGYCGPILSRDVYRNRVIGDLSDPNGGSVVYMRNKSLAG